MLEEINHSLFAMLGARSGFLGFALSGPFVLAEWAILLGPALLVALWIFGSTGDRRAAIGEGLSAILAVAVAATLSMVIWHPRPFMDSLSANYLNHAADSSISNDHATLLFALWLVPPLLLLRAWIAMMGVALAVGLARVYLGVQHPFDIFGAAIVGLLSAGVCATLPGKQARDALTLVAEWLLDRVLNVFRHRKGL